MKHCNTSALGLTIFILAGYLPVVSQSHSTSIGARTAGLAFASSCIADEWSVLGNPGGLDGSETTVVAVSREVNTKITAFDRSAFAFAQPLLGGVAAMGVYRFGDDIYSEQMISAGFGNTYGLASLGLRISYIQYRADGFGARGAVTASFGGIARLTKSLSIGACVSNINQPRLTEDRDGEKIPTRISSGIAIRPSAKVFLTVEAEKDLDHALSVRSALEYAFFKSFQIRTGFSVAPLGAYGGIGLRPRKIGIDYAFGADVNLGVRHSLSIAYRFVKK